MKKKLGKINKKIRHSKKKHNSLISKRSPIKKKIEELKGPSEGNEEVLSPEESFNPVELEARIILHDQKPDSRQNLQG